MSRHGKSSAVLLAAGVLVALGAAAATAHGLFEVAAASGVPAGIAWIYPLITDGLAIVAYAATSRLDDAGRRYAWSVVILAAGLSGVAQAVFLAGGIGAAGGAAQSVPQVLRFGVGAWPAIAAAIVAHLLFMLATDHRPNQTGHGAVDGAVTAVEPVAPSTRPVAPERVQRPAVQPSPVQSRPVQSGALNASAPSEAAERTAELPALVQSNAPTDSAAPADGPRRPGTSPASPKRDRALREARKHAARSGSLPTVDQLMQLAEVSRGTAGTALQELREQPAALHLITEASTTKANS
ncbi:hypothetical protein [Amycolatopsis alkalitolerans]|uniref:DUF2637 domain-containing protein n=1 Tax=Amycolatopsis alkalitolerans TaxID=2547244 RepID=A0A5C4LRE5_9PSEU|nr:hypothetical protein [Amycolatopsis alkalitolerans]TNC20897.1 hypothetical protein FG385_29890 [Amycolatopsis alkalitolerans]